MSFFACRLIFVCILFVTVRSLPFQQIAECTNRVDCGPDACCVIGMHRFSVPSCKPLGQQGDYCVNGGKSQNLTLAFPNGLSIRVSETYTLFCPCDVGLICHRAQCVYREDSRLNDVI